MQAVIQYVIQGQNYPWPLMLQKTKGRKPTLIGNSLTTPAFPKSFFAISEYTAKQSGPDTGHACAEFRFVVTNQCEQALQEVEAIVMHGSLEAARGHIGDMAPGESRSVFAITTRELGMLLPPGGPYIFVTLTSEPVYVCLAYQRETDWGNEWSEQHRCQNDRKKK